MASASSAACQATSMTHKIRENWKKRHERERAMSMDAAAIKRLTPVLESVGSGSSNNPTQQSITQANTNSSNALVHKPDTPAIPVPVPPPPPPPPSIASSTTDTSAEHQNHELLSQSEHLKTGSTTSLTTMLMDKLVAFGLSSGRRRHVSGENPPVVTNFDATADDICFPRRRHRSNDHCYFNDELSKPH